MKTSKNGIDLIKNFEGLRLKAYKCPSGVLTIGWGHTTNVKINQIITQKEALEFLQKDIQKFEVQINSLVKVPLNQNQYDAIISFVFNIGIGNFKKSTMLKLLNLKQYENSAKQILRWNLSKGKVLKGLVRRRKAEYDLFTQQ